MEVKINCPKCNSPNVDIIAEEGNPIPQYKCSKCGYKNNLFPQIGKSVEEEMGADEELEDDEEIEETEDEIPEIKSNYEVMKIEMKDFKQKLIDYFRKPMFDVTLSQLMEDFDLEMTELNLLQYCMDELVEEKWITKVGAGFDHYEYDPGEKLDFGGLQ